MMKQQIKQKVAGATKVLQIAVLMSFYCLSTGAYAQDRPAYRVVTTTGMIRDLVESTAGAQAGVQSLIGSGIDPHLYKPTRSDIAAVLGANLVFYNGLLLEGKMTDALTRAARSGKKVYAVAELIDAKHLLQTEEFAGQYDPHVWMDPVAWAKVAEVIREKLIAFDPAHAEKYIAQSKKLLAELEALQHYSKTALGSIPPESRILVTAHDAFNYFGRRYGFEVIAIQGMSTESEAGVQDIERIINTIVARKVRAVFVESTVSERNVRALVEGAEAQGHVVKIGGNLFSDAMGPPNTYEGTYVGMIDHNVTQITRALGGKAPRAGMRGRLTQVAE